MPRNLFERCEVVFPVRDPAALARIHDEILPAYLADTVKARIQQSDGIYARASKLMKDAQPFSSQEFLMHLAEGKTDLDAMPSSAGKPGAKDGGLKSVGLRLRSLGDDVDPALRVLKFQSPVAWR